MPVTLHNVGHRFGGGPWLFRHLNETFVAGITGIVGPSGTGKSTLLRIIFGDLAPSEGRMSGITKDQVAFVHQTAHGVAKRTVRDHLALPALVAGASRAGADAAAVRVAGLFGLGDLLNAPYRQLSGGEAQRLMLATALATGRNVIIADEPTASLDAGNATNVISTLQHLTTRGATVLIATHDTRIVAACDQVLDLTGRGGDAPA